MLDICLVAVGKIKDKNYQAAAAEYLKRLKPYARLKVIELSSAAFSGHSQKRAREQESERLAAVLADRPGAVYLLAERGKLFDSPRFAAFINQNQPLTLVLGGALGFSESLYQSYPQLSLSPLTFPHEMARLILLEQLYRSATILNQKDYHY